MEINQPLSLSSSDGYDDQHRDPNNYIDQSASDIVSEFNHLNLNRNHSSDPQQSIPDSSEEDEEENDDEEGDFTFTCIGDNESITSTLTENNQIQTVFPLFDQSLLSESDYDDLKVFIESPSSTASSTAGVATGPYFSGTPELKQKSNSTGFSKLWRFRDKVSRSNSDGRDAFVFLNSSDRETTSSSKAVAGDASPAKVNGAGGGKAKAVKKGSKAKTTSSAHEVYLKRRVGQTEEERRRSYLPYRPEVMGFFTNVNGGLSRNVHPF